MQHAATNPWRVEPVEPLTYNLLDGRAAFETARRLYPNERVDLSRRRTDHCAQRAGGGPRASCHSERDAPLSATGAMQARSRTGVRREPYELATVVILAGSAGRLARGPMILAPERRQPSRPSMPLHKGDPFGRM
jgi:hypothetical protein